MSFRKLFYVLISGFSLGEREGLVCALKLMLKLRKMLSLLITFSLIAALLEGGTIGILGLAVSVLVGEQSNSIGQMIGGVPFGIGDHFQTISRSGLFLAFVGVAIIVQILKSLALYISQAAQIFLSTALRVDIQDQVVSQMMLMSYSQVTHFVIKNSLN